jgi:hypothetical protein
MRITHTGILNAAATACLLLAATHSGADVLELKNGRVLTGKYVGGTAGTIRFETGGNVQAVETSQALALTFSTVTPPAEAPPPAAPVPAAPVETTPVPVAAPGSVTVPAGTVMLVRMVDGASSRDQSGKRFATVLETDLVVNGVMVAKAGTKVYGRVEKAVQAGRFAGKSVLDLKLRELTIGGTLVPIVTGSFAQAGAGSLGKTAKGAVAGTAIGAIVDGSHGAGKGAAIGAVASGLKKGDAIVVPPDMLLEFQLQQPLTINAAR